MTTICIDGKSWLYTGVGWLLRRRGAWVVLNVGDERGLVDALVDHSHGDEFSYVSLVDGRGWEWAWDNGWVYEREGEHYRVHLVPLADGGWTVSRCAYGWAETTLGGMCLDAALERTHEWLESLWSCVVGDLVWDEEVEAFVGVMGRYDVILSRARYGQWCAELLSNETLRYHLSSTDPRAAWLELQALLKEDTHGTTHEG